MKHIIIALYVLYLKSVKLKQKLFGGKAHGLGWVPSKIPFEFDFTYAGAKFRFVPSAARSYGYLPANISNEPETLIFLTKVLENYHCDVFVDVGASIGEFVIFMAHNHKVRKVIAFEPHPLSCWSLEKSSHYAPAGKIEIIAKGCSSSSGRMQFNQNASSPTAASLVDCLNSEDLNQITVDICTLDDELSCHESTAAIILIDVEGGELEVVLGATRYIEKTSPIIIFEYNNTTREFFAISEMKNLLGSQYTLFRLRSVDGLLDQNLEDTWNIVALPISGCWSRIIHAPEFFAP